MSNLTRKPIVAMLVVAAATATSYAEPASHQGVLVRAAPGFGAASGDYDGMDLRMLGPTGQLGLSAGYAERPGLLWSGDFVVHSKTHSTTATDDSVFWRASYVGLGLNWYTFGNV